jgi:hypothetical protein
MFYQIIHSSLTGALQLRCDSPSGVRFLPEQFDSPETPPRRFRNAWQFYTQLPVALESFTFMARGT